MPPSDLGLEIDDWFISDPCLTTIDGVYRPDRGESIGDQAPGGRVFYGLSAPQRPRHSYRVSVWDMDTFRPDENGVSLPSRFDRAELGFTSDGKTLVVQGVPEPKVSGAEAELAASRARMQR